MPGHRIYKSLINAVKRGVEVNVCIPQHSDVKVADVVRDAFLEQLYKHGVNIYLYPKGNLHSKLMLIDDNVFAIGSANMDTRSLEHHFEVTSILYNRHCAEIIETQFHHDLKRCHLLSAKKWKKRPKYFRFFESLARLLSPLL